MMLPQCLYYLLAGLLPNLPQIEAHQKVLELDHIPKYLDFTLRHVHAVTNTSRNIFADVRPSSLVDASHHRTRLKSRAITTHRPIHVFGPRGETAFVGWEDEPIHGPDVTDRETVLQLAMMTNNAYVEEGDKDWYQLPAEWDVSNI
jgi:lipase ATG15